MTPEIPAPFDAGHLISLATLGLILTITTFTELRENRIPNWVTLPGLLIGFLVGYFPGGLTLGESFAGFFVGFGFLYLFYMFGGMGGGDVKLMGAVGALLGYPMVLSALMLTAFIGGIMAVLALVWNRNAWRQISGSLARLVGRRGSEDEGESEGASGTVPYGLAIVAGSLLSIFLSGR